MRYTTKYCFTSHSLELGISHGAKPNFNLANFDYIAMLHIS
jgi:hypothetical protein